MMGHNIYISNAVLISSYGSTTLECLPGFNCVRSYLYFYFAMAIENRGPQVEAVAIAFLALSWVTISLRCYVRLFMKKLFRIDDWLAVVSLVCFTYYLLLALGVTNCLKDVLHILLQRCSSRCKSWHRTTYLRYLKRRFFNSYDGKAL
jgi:hypothetical protein